MANYQQYQQYRRQPQEKGYKFGKIIIILAIVFVLYLILKSIFGGSGEVDTITPGENINTTISEEVNVNTSDEVNANSNENSNTNSTNVNVDTASADSFDLESCTRVFSRGSTENKQVSLTFNVGTTKEGDIQKVIDILKNSNTKADFFARGDVAEENPDLINKIDSAGFSIYNLSYSHPYFSDLPTSGMVEQLEKAETAISQRTNKTTKPFFRPPYGDADADVVSVVVAEGYCPVTWTVDAYDWSSDYTSAQSKERVLDNVSNGAIILMQAANATTAEILGDLITQLSNQGFAIVNLDTLLK